MRRLIVVLGFALGGLLLAHHPMLLSGFARTQHDLGDTRYVHYMLEHGYRWALRWPGYESLWSPAFFYPAKNVAAYSEILLGAGPLYWPWRIVGLPPDSALQAWVLTTSVLNFGLAYWLFRKGLGVNGLGAAAGAAVFAFAAIRVNQTKHYQLFGQVGSLLAVFGLLRLSSDGLELAARRAWIWVFSLSVALQLWAGFYLGWFLVLGLGVALAWALAVPSARRPLREIARATPFTWGLAMAAAAASLYPMASHYLAAGTEVGMRSFQETLPMVPRLHSWLHLGSASWFYGWAASHEPFRSLPMEHEQRIGFGILTTAVAAVGLWQARHRPAVRIIGLTGATVLVLSTTYGDFVFWRWVHDWVPGAKAIRAVCRIGLLVLFPVAVGVAHAVARLARARRPLVASIAAPLAVLCLLEQAQTTPAFDKIRTRREIADIAAHVGPDCTAFVFTPVGGRHPPFKYQLDAMWAQLETGVPTLNGFSGDVPPGWMLGRIVLRSPDDERHVAGAIRLWARSQDLDPARVCWAKVAVP